MVKWVLLIQSENVWQVYLQHFEHKHARQSEIQGKKSKRSVFKPTWKGRVFQRRVFTWQSWSIFWIPIAPENPNSMRWWPRFSYFPLDSLLFSNFQTFFMAASLSSSTLLFCSVLHPFCGEKRKRNISTFTEKQHISKKKDLKAKFHPFQISRPMSVSMLSWEKQLGLSNNRPLLLKPLLLLLQNQLYTVLPCWIKWNMETLTFYVSQQDSQAGLIYIPAYRIILIKSDYHNDLSSQWDNYALYDETQWKPLSVHQHSIRHIIF